MRNIWTCLFLAAMAGLMVPLVWARDVNSDGYADFIDLSVVAAAFDSTMGQADLNANGIVDIFDFNIVIGSIFLGANPSPVDPTPSPPLPTTTPSLSSTPTPTQVPQEYFDHYVAMTGSDRNMGDRNNPFRTIQHAVDLATAGSTILVQPGSYHESVLLSGNQLHLVSDEAVITQIRVTGNNNSVDNFVIDGEDKHNAGIRVSGNNNTFTGNEIYNTHQDGIWFFGKGHVFRHNYIHDIIQRASDPHIDCFQTWGPAEDMLIDANTCHNPNTYGSNQMVMLENLNSPVRNIRFTNNVIIMDDPGYSPMNFHRKSGQDVIEDIEVVGNTLIHRNGKGRSGVKFSGISGGRALNNIFVDYGEGEQYINYPNSENITIAGNALYMSDGADPVGGIRVGDIKVSDPGFINAAVLDFHLRPDSPLIDEGVEVSGLTTDRDGRSRPNGSHYDIGAYEFLDR